MFKITEPGGSDHDLLRILNYRVDALIDLEKAAKRLNLVEALDMSATTIPTATTILDNNRDNNRNNNNNYNNWTLSELERSIDSSHVKDIISMKIKVPDILILLFFFILHNCYFF